MKNTVYRYGMLMALMLALLVGFASCEDEDMVELTLDRTAMQIREGSEGILKVESGNGSYKFSFSPDGLATARFRDNLIYISAKAYGKTVMTVTDASGHTAVLDIVITSAVLKDKTPRFKWDRLVELDKANSWGFTCYENKVVMTNYSEKSQYVLAWDGDLGVGTKENAKLTVVKAGEVSEPLTLAGMEVLDVTDGRYSVAFSSTNRQGELVFVKP